MSNLALETFGASTTACRVERVEIERRTYPLTKPYVLSFVTLDAFVSLVATVRLDDGRSQTAEVVPLFGYSDETEADLLAALEQIGAEAQGVAVSELRQTLADRIDISPFSVTAVLTAIDQFDWPWEPPAEPGVGFVEPVSAEDLSGLATVADRSLHGTFKLKLSGRTDVDITAMSLLESVISADPRELRFRFDANQAYDFQTAKGTFGWLSESPFRQFVDYIEQPLADDDWMGHEMLAKRYPDVPLMLDESIVTKADVDRAKEIGVGYVKLKLFKQGGILELLEMSEYAHEMGLPVVLGNGVATDLSNGIELKAQRLHPQWFFGASEANGYLKIAAQ